MGASSQTEETRHRMPIIAEQEILLWSQMLQSKETILRGVVAWTLCRMREYAPAPESGRLIIELMSDDDPRVRQSATKGLYVTNNEILLKETLIRLKKAGYDDTFELLTEWRDWRKYKSNLGFYTSIITQKIRRLIAKIRGLHN